MDHPTPSRRAERAAIFEIWQRVTEDYVPFDVNVTTADPGVEALRRTGTIDVAYGQRVVISPTNWYAPASSCALPGQSCTLGIALVGVFDRNSDTPAFAFTADVSVRTIAEAVSHEVGHTFGLNHDATASSTYYNGHGVWAPIMGRGTDPSKPFTQWSKGEYSGANNVQDDLDLIASLTGYRPDDHGGVPERATLVSSSSTTSGIIGATGDRDVFAVDVGAGNLSVTLRPPPGARDVDRISWPGSWCATAPGRSWRRRRRRFRRRGRSPPIWRSRPAATPSRSNRSDGSTHRRASPPTVRSAPTRCRWRRTLELRRRRRGPRRSRRSLRPGSSTPAAESAGSPA